MPFVSQRATLLHATGKSKKRAKTGIYESAKVKAHLTDKLIKSYAGPAMLWDRVLPAFGVRIGLHKKTFLVMTGKERRRTNIGRYPQLSLQEARFKARAILIAPPKPSILFQDALAQYVALHLIPNTKPRSAYQIELGLKKHFAHFNTATLVSLTRREIIETIDGLIETPATANQALSFLTTFLNWCVKRSLLENNPIAGYGAAVNLKPRERLLTDVEIKLIWQESYNHNSFGCIVRLLILTGQRLNQISSLQSAWINAPQDTIVFPAYIMKSNVEHVLPLTQATHQEIIASSKVSFSASTPMPHLNPLPSHNSTPQFIFPAPSGDKPFSSHSQPTKKLRAALPHVSHFTLHDFRRHFSSTMAKLGTPLDVTEAILAHTSGSRSQIQRTYDRFDRMEPMRRALELYENYLATDVLAERTPNSRDHLPTPQQLRTLPMPTIG